MAKLEREIDQLFELRLDEFTAKRNELARRLKREGDKEAAEQVQALEKPSVPVWAINQLARRERASVKALMDAGSKLMRAQERALAGGQSDSLRDAQSKERGAVRELTRQAEEVLKEAGRPPSRAIVERISATLGAAAVTESARGALKAGRLTGEISLTGFEALAGIDVPVQRTAPRDELAERRTKKSETERERRRLKAQAREFETRAKESERRAAGAEEAARKTRAQAEQDRRAADAAAVELEEFEGQK